MAKSIAQQIAEAAAKGDLEKVQELAGKIIPKTKAKAKTSKAKPKAKSKPKKTPTPAAEDVIGAVPEESQPDEAESFVSVARKSDQPKSHAFVDNNGVARVKSEPVPFEKKKRKNEWKDDKKSNLVDVEIDRKLNPRQTRNAEKRPPARKIQMKCFVCKKMVETWPVPVGDHFTCDYCLNSK